MSDDRQPPPDKGYLDNFLLYVALSLLAGYVASFTFFLRSRMGSRYLGVGYCGGICVQWLWATYYPAHDIFMYTILWMIVGVGQKFCTSLYTRSGGELHRMDGGQAAVMGWIPVLGGSDRLAKCVLEPGLVFLAGTGLAGLLPGLARFFIWGSLAMLVKANIEEAIFMEKVASGRDAYVRAKSWSRHVQQRR